MMHFKKTKTKTKPPQKNKKTHTPKKKDNLSMTQYDENQTSADFLNISLCQFALHALKLPLNTGVLE
jgi:hypothetical protein